MKKFITVCLLTAALVLGCATAQPAVQECEPAVVGEFTDHVGDTMLFIDEDCDQLCDFAVLLAFMGYNEEAVATYAPVAMISCEEAAYFIEQYKKDRDNNSINF